MKPLKTAIEKAAHDTALYATLELRNHAISDGWEPEVADGLSVEYVDGKFNTKIHSGVSDRAFVHEYGTEVTRPKATVRTFKEDNSHIKEVFARQLHKHLGGAL